MRSPWLLYLLMLAQPAYAQTNFQLTGQLQGMAADGEKVFLYYSIGDKRVTDSAEVRNGAYRFSGFTAEPVMSRLRIMFRPKDSLKPAAVNMARDMVSIFLEPGTLQVVSTDSFSNIQVTGSASHTEYLQLKGLLAGVRQKQESLMQQYRDLKMNNDKAGMEAIEKQFDAIDQEERGIHRQYLEANPQSPLAIYALGQFAGWDIDASAVAPLFDALPEEKKQLPSARELYRKIEIAQKSSVGQTAVDFTQNDTLGNPVTLSAFRGKYVLLDFWASWCGPCRAENPNLVKAFSRFKDRGFHIIGISLDQPNGKEKWLKAIHDDQLAWTQLSDLNFWNNAVAVQYGIQAIPQNFLLDPKGKIIARNLRGEELMGKLEEILK